MSEQEIKETLAGTADSNPLWRAMTAVLDQHCNSWIDQSIGPTSIGESRAYAAGAAFGLQQVRDALDILRKAP